MLRVVLVCFVDLFGLVSGSALDVVTLGVLSAAADNSRDRFFWESMLLKKLVRIQLLETRQGLVRRSCR